MLKFLPLCFSPILPWCHWKIALQLLRDRQRENILVAFLVEKRGRVAEVAVTSREECVLWRTRGKITELGRPDVLVYPGRTRFWALCCVSLFRTNKSSYQVRPFAYLNWVTAASLGGCKPLTSWPNPTPNGHNPTQHLPSAKDDTPRGASMC